MALAETGVTRPRVGERVQALLETTERHIDRHEFARWVADVSDDIDALPSGPRKIVRDAIERRRVRLINFGRRKRG